MINKPDYSIGVTSAGSHKGNHLRISPCKCQYIQNKLNCNSNMVVCGIVVPLQHSNKYME